MDRDVRRLRPHPHAKTSPVTSGSGPCAGVGVRHLSKALWRLLPLEGPLPGRSRRWNVCVKEQTNSRRWPNSDGWLSAHIDSLRAVDPARVKLTDTGITLQALSVTGPSRDQEASSVDQQRTC